MFNKKDEDSKTPSTSTSSVDAISISIPTTKPAIESHSIVDTGLTMKGDLETDGDILVNGTVKGNIRCTTLIVSDGAVVDGEVVAEELTVRGSTIGVIRANRVRLESTARVESEIYHRSFSAEEGANIKGGLWQRENPLSEDTKPTRADKGARDSASKKSAPTAEIAIVPTASKNGDASSGIM